MYFIYFAKWLVSLKTKKIRAKLKAEKLKHVQ